jgi:hypothetical protein
MKMKTLTCVIMAAFGVACNGETGMSPKESKSPAAAPRRLLMSFETGPGMQQFTPRPTLRLYSDGELRSSDAAHDGDGTRVLLLEPAVVTRLIEIIDALEEREVKHELHKHDAQSHTWAAWRTDGTRIVLQSGQGEDAWRHPGGDDALAILGALRALSG